MAARRYYRGFMAARGGSQVIEELFDFLSWSRADWQDFSRWLDKLEDTRSHGRWRTRRAWRQTLYSMIRSGFLEQKRVGKHSFLRFSDLGWRLGAARRIRNISARGRKGWCVVAFDFPEKQRADRDVFRSFLKAAGFVQLQRSVWGSSRDVIQQVCEVVDDAGIDEWVTVIEGTIERGKKEEAREKRRS